MDEQQVAISGEMIRLGQLLKLAGVVEDGARARQVIEDGEVRVDGKVERRRGCQIHPQSTVEFGDELLRVVAD